MKFYLEIPISKHFYEISNVKILHIIVYKIKRFRNCSCCYRNCLVLLLQCLVLLPELFSVVIGIVWLTSSFKSSVPISQSIWLYRSSSKSYLNSESSFLTLSPSPSRVSVLINTSGSGKYSNKKYVVQSWQWLISIFC